MGAANVNLWAFPSTETADQSTPHPDGHAPSSAAPTQVSQEAAKACKPLSHSSSDSACLLCSSLCRFLNFNLLPITRCVIKASWQLQVITNNKHIFSNFKY